MRLEWASLGLTDRRALCRALQDQRGQTRGSAAPPSPDAPSVASPPNSGAFLCPGPTSETPPHSLLLRALSMVTVTGFQQRVVTPLGQTKLALQEGLLANGSVLGKKPRFSFVQRRLLGWLPPPPAASMSPVLSHMCPSPHLSCPGFLLYLPVFSALVPRPVHSHTWPPGLSPRTGLHVCLPSPVPRTCRASHSPVVLPQFLKHLLDDQPGVGAGEMRIKTVQGCPRL